MSVSHFIRWLLYRDAILPMTGILLCSCVVNLSGQKLRLDYVSEAQPDISGRITRLEKGDWVEETYCEPIAGGANGLVNSVIVMTLNKHQCQALANATFEVFVNESELQAAGKRVNLEKGPTPGTCIRMRALTLRDSQGASVVAPVTTPARVRPKTKMSY